MATTPDLAGALAAFGVGSARSQLLAFAARTDAFTAQMAVEATGVSRSALGSHLNALTASGVLSRDARLQDHGRGMMFWWSLDADRTLSLVNVIVRELG